MEKRQTKPSFRRELKRVHGEVCHICGRSPVEYHHLIPLWAGGEEVIGNYIALCRPHHLAMHGVFGKKRLTHCGGRPRDIPPEGYETVLDGYFRCQYGRKRCEKLLPLTGSRKLNDKWWYKDYIIKHGISKHRNNVDTLFKKHNGNMKGIPLDREIGYVRYQDGKTDVYSVGDVEIW